MWICSHKHENMYSCLNVLHSMYIRWPTCRLIHLRSYHYVWMTERTPGQPICLLLYALKKKKSPSNRMCVWTRNDWFWPRRHCEGYCGPDRPSTAGLTQLDLIWQNRTHFVGSLEWVWPDLAAVIHRHRCHSTWMTWCNYKQVATTTAKCWCRKAVVAFSLKKW